MVTLTNTLNEIGTDCIAFKALLLGIYVNPFYVHFPTRGLAIESKDNF